MKKNHIKSYKTVAKEKKLKIFPKKNEKKMIKMKKIKA